MTHRLRARHRLMWLLLFPLALLAFLVGLQFRRPWSLYVDRVRETPSSAAPASTKTNDRTTP